MTIRASISPIQHSVNVRWICFGIFLNPMANFFQSDIANAATGSARMMVSEVLGWRVIFQDRPLKTT